MPKISDYDLPAVSTRTRLQIQKRLDERGKRAMTQREETPELLPTKEDVKVLNIDDDRPEVIAAKHRKAVAIQVRLQNMSNNQIVDELDWKPSVIKSEITQQMIDEHRAEQNAPVKITRPDGREEYFRYNNGSVDLEPIDIPRDTVFSDDQKRDLAARIMQNAIRSKAIDKELRDTIPTERAALEAEFDKGSLRKGPEYFVALTKQAGDATTKKQQDALAAKLGIGLGSSGRIARRREILLEEIERQKVAPVSEAMTVETYETAMAALQAKSEQLAEQQKAYQSDTDYIKELLKDNEASIKKNKVIDAEEEKQNASRIKVAYDTLKSLNAGKPIPEQQPGESDDAYRQRLIDLGDEVLDDDEVQRSAESLQIVRAKYNLKEFISDASKIENIIKKLSSDELTVFNTSFPAYKKKYLETYGFNNRNMSVDDIVGFIQSDSTTPPAAAAPPPAPPAARSRAANRPYAVSSFNRTQLLHLTDTNGLPRRRTNQEMYDELLSRDLIPKIGDPYFVPTFPDVPAYDPFPAAPTTTPTRGRARSADPVRSMGPELRGIGVRLRKLPSVVQFGKIHIKPSNLYYENILSIRTSTGQALRAYKDEKISNHLASLIIKLLEGGTVSKNDLRSLSEKEVMIYDNLIRRSQLHKELDNSWDETAIKMKTRFQILEGQIMAGNDNPLIKEELHELLFKMGNAKIITPHDASRYWNELNK